MSLVTADIVDRSKCQYCGMIHGPMCPRIAAIEYHENGQVKRVEFYDATGANGRSITDHPLYRSTNSNWTMAHNSTIPGVRQ